MTNAYIKLNNLSLDYCYYTNRNTLKKTIVKSIFRLWQSPKEKTFKLRRALDGVDASFQTGDRIALIGKNGSGKSTLLRVLSGIYQPTEGSLEIHGTITSLLDISIGLNPDINGYENITLMGILQGKSKKEMKEKFAEIEEFTELGHYLQFPVRTYSVGMRLRLAFGIATCMESDIIIIDEVIGVGDQSFMEKAQNRLKNLVHKSQILVLTSHATNILQHFCNKAMVLNQGRCTYFGNLEKGIEHYSQIE